MCRTALHDKGLTVVTKAGSWVVSTWRRVALPPCRPARHTSTRTQGGGVGVITVTVSRRSLVGLNLASRAPSWAGSVHLASGSPGVRRC